MNLFNIPIMPDTRPTLEHMLCEIVDRGDLTIRRITMTTAQMMQFAYRRRTDGEKFTMRKMMATPQFAEPDMRDAIAYIHSKLT